MDPKTWTITESAIKKNPSNLPNPFPLNSTLKITEDPTPGTYSVTDSSSWAFGKFSTINSTSISGTATYQNGSSVTVTITPIPNPIEPNPINGSYQPPSQDGPAGTFTATGSGEEEEEG